LYPKIKDREQDIAMLISMRQTLVLKWIKEVNIEIEKAKKEINLSKILDLRLLKDTLIRLKDESY